MSLLKQFTSTMKSLVGASAMLRVATPTSTGKSVASVTSATAHLFAPFPYDLDPDHEPFQLPLEALCSVASVTTAKTTVRVKEESLEIVTGAKHRVELAFVQSTDALYEAPTIDNPTASFVVGQDTLTQFRQLLQVMAIEKIHAAQADFRLYVKYSKSKMFIAVYSPMQVVCAEVESTISSSGEFNVPLPSFQSLIKAVPSPGCRFSFADDSILVNDHEYTILTIVPPLSPKDPPGEVVQKSSAMMLERAAPTSITFTKAHLEEYIGASRGVITDDTPVRFVPDDKYITLEAATVASNSSYRIRTLSSSMTEPFALELKFLKNLLSKSGDEISLSVADDVLVMKSGKLGLITTTFSDNTAEEV